MKYIVLGLVSVLAGAFASMGLGGGMILLIYLIVFSHTDQLASQGINLMFFIPIALIAVIVHEKNKLIEWKIILPTVLSGIAGTLIGVFITDKLGSDMLSKLFAVFLIIIGIREVIKAKRENRDRNNPNSSADSNKA